MEGLGGVVIAIGIVQTVATNFRSNLDRSPQMLKEKNIDGYNISCQPDSSHDMVLYQEVKVYKYDVYLVSQVSVTSYSANVGTKTRPT